MSQCECGLELVCDSPEHEWRVAHGALAVAAAYEGWAGPDGAGVFELLLGARAYALVDWDGKYRVGLYGRWEASAFQLPGGPPISVDGIGEEDGRFIHEFDNLADALDYVHLLQAILASANGCDC